MSFELTTDTDGNEYVDEIITHTTRKRMSKDGIAAEVAKLQEEIEERQDRIIVLLAQNDKFTAVAEVTK